MEQSSESSQVIDNYIEYSNDENEEEQDGRSSESDQKSWDIPIRSRQRFPRDQLKYLEDLYSVTKRPNFEEKEKLANKFGTTSKRIQIWFQNRRAKDKKVSASSSDSTVSTATKAAITPSLSPQATQDSSGTRSSRFKRKSSGPPVHSPVPVPVPLPRRRAMVPERHPMAFPGNKQVPETGEYYQAFYHPNHNMWYQGYRLTNPHLFNQSPPTNDPKPYYTRTTRSQTKKRKM